MHARNNFVEMLYPTLLDIAETIGMEMQSCFNNMMNSLQTTQLGAERKQVSYIGHAEHVSTLARYHLCAPACLFYRMSGANIRALHM